MFAPLWLQWLKCMVTCWIPSYFYRRVTCMPLSFGTPVVMGSPPALVHEQGRLCLLDRSFRSIRSTGYPCLIDCRELHPIDICPIRPIDMHGGLPRPPSACSLPLGGPIGHVSPRLAPRDVLLCSHNRWLARPTRAIRELGGSKDEAPYPQCHAGEESLLRSFWRFR